MSDQPYPPLRPQTPLRIPARRTPWPLITAIGFMVIVTIILAVLLFTRNDDAGTAFGSESGSPSASADASLVASSSASGSAAPPSVSASPTVSGTPAVSATPAPTPAPLTADIIVAAAVDGLSVRSGPGTSQEKLGSLEIGARSFIVAGPTEADGFAWYLVSALGLPPNTGCAGPVETDPYNCPAWFGWVAAASDAGEAWLQPANPDCPPLPFTAESLILARTDLQRLACQHAEPFTFRAWWPEIPPDAPLGGACVAAAEPSGWLYCQGINYNQVTISESEGFGGVGARISIDPASGLAMPPRGTWVELRVHLDDPASQGCDEAAAAASDTGRPAEQHILDCRGQMVLEAATAVAGP